MQSKGRNWLDLWSNMKTKHLGKVLLSFATGVSQFDLKSPWQDIANFLVHGMYAGIAGLKRKNFGTSICLKKSERQSYDKSQDIF